MKKPRRSKSAKIPEYLKTKAKRCPVCDKKQLYTKDGESICQNCNFRHVDLTVAGGAQLIGHKYAPMNLRSDVKNSNVDGSSGHDNNANVEHKSNGSGA